MTREEALAFAKTLEKDYPRWLEILPPCPCTLADAKAKPDDWEVKEAFLGKYHPGAKTSVRSTKTFESKPGTTHGQQCCYDDDGNLITEGPGAGTPDLYGPAGGLFGYSPGHMSYDVETFELLGWRVYNQYWKPNCGKGCGCKANAGKGTRIGSGKFKLVGKFEGKTVAETDNVIVVETGNKVDSTIQVTPDNDAAIKLFGTATAVKYVSTDLLKPMP